MIVLLRVIESKRCNRNPERLQQTYSLQPVVLADEGFVLLHSRPQLHPCKATANCKPFKTLGRAYYEVAVLSRIREIREKCRQQSVAT